MENRYVELLGDGELDLLGRVSGHGPRVGATGGPSVAAAWFRSEPARIEMALADPVTLDNLFDPDGDEPLAVVSPLLVFAVVVGRGAVEIGDHRHVIERVGTSLRLPVFDGDRLARFTADPQARAFLVELLGSYTRVLSGARWEQTRGRWRRRRFSEMNPAQLAQMAAELPLAERAGAYRRLGDLALFLNGVFPDHSARRTLSPIELDRIVRSLPPDQRIDSARLLETDRIDGTGPVLAALGPAWYRLAAELVPLPDMAAQLAHVAGHFEQARRFLNFVTDRYLWNRRDRLFPA
jgi:hypothetical protein